MRIGAVAQYSTRLVVGRRIRRWQARTFLRLGVVDRKSYTHRMLGKVERSGLFDVIYYLGNCPEACASNIDPIEHYFRWGEKQGLKPHPLFDPAYYTRTNGDVEAAGINALYHFLSMGANEGRWPNPWFDPGWYLAQYPDVAASRMNPLKHYATFGNKENRHPGAAFDSNWYRAQHLSAHPDVDPLLFHMECGAAAGLATNSGGATSPVKPHWAPKRTLDFIEQSNLFPKVVAKPAVVRIRGQQRSLDNATASILDKMGGAIFADEIEQANRSHLTSLVGSRPNYEMPPQLLFAPILQASRNMGPSEALLTSSMAYGRCP